MFSSAIKSVNSNSNSKINIKALSDINKRSKVCDADSNGKVNANCKR